MTMLLSFLCVIGDWLKQHLLESIAVGEDSA